MKDGEAGRSIRQSCEEQLRAALMENARLAAALEASHDAAARYEAILASATDYAIFTIDPAGYVTSWNSGAELLLGWPASEAIGMDSRLLFTPEDRESGEADAEIAQAAESGRAGNERWHLRRDGVRFWGSGLLLPLTRGQQRGYLKIMRDRTERRQADERQALLLGELSHRVKNSLAVVLSVARQSGNRAPDVATFLADFEGRMRALAAAHDLLSRTGWLGASSKSLVKVALGADGEDRIRLHVEELPLKPAAAQGLVLALHELQTNALKHGALTCEAGRVELNLIVEGEELVLTWRESGGPPVVQSDSRGFGTTLLERSIAHQHRGRIYLDWRNEGLACTIRIPTSEAISGTAVPSRSA